MKYLLLKIRYLLANRLSLLGIMLIFALTFTGCGDLFEAQNTNDVLTEDLDNPNLIPVFGNSAEGALSVAYSLAVVMSASPADGVIAASTNQNQKDPDRGLFRDTNTDITTLWNELAAARWTTTEVTRRLENMLDNPKSSILLAQSYFWDGIARITLADMFREVPFDGGPPNPPIAVYEGAIKRLIKANEIAQASANSPESTKYAAVSFASIARAYRSLHFERGGDISAFAEAAEYAQKALEIDPTFSIEIRYQSPGIQNDVFQRLNEVKKQVMDPDYASLRDPVTGEQDPRIEHSPVLSIGVSGDTLYAQMKYPSGNADIPVSRWQEAELILAEYALLQGDLGQAIVHINRVRNAAGLSPFASSEPQEIKAQIIYERKAEFWLELRRWQDMRYYNIIPDRWYPVAKEMGVDRRFPTSLREQTAN